MVNIHLPCWSFAATRTISWQICNISYIHNTHFTRRFFNGHQRLLSLDWLYWRLFSIKTTVFGTEILKIISMMLRIVIGWKIIQDIIFLLSFVIMFPPCCSEFSSSETILPFFFIEYHAANQFTYFEKKNDIDRLYVLVGWLHLKHRLQESYNMLSHSCVVGSGAGQRAVSMDSIKFKHFKLKTVMYSSYISIAITVFILWQETLQQVIHCDGGAVASSFSLICVWREGWCSASDRHCLVTRSMHRSKHCFPWDFCYNYRCCFVIVILWQTRFVLIHTYI